MKYYCILIVDDEPHIVTLLLKLLDSMEDMDLDVYYAYNAADALEIIKKGSIDLLITDIKMPGTTGLELLEEVNRRGQGTKAILLTAYPDFQYAYEAFRKKAISYLLKTEEPEAIKDAIVHALELVDQDRRLAKYEEAVPEKRYSDNNTDKTHLLVDSLKAYIDSHAVEDVSLIKLSEMTGYNSSYISWLFHNETGMKLNRYISQKKMDLINGYLRNSALSIDEIIEKTGFNSRRYFNIFVKRETGMAPGEYRRVLQRAEERLEEKGG